MCRVDTATFASFLRVTVYLTLIAGFWGERVVILLTSLPTTHTATREAKTCDTVPAAESKQSVKLNTRWLLFIFSNVSNVPLSSAVVSSRASTEVAPVCVRAAKLAWVVAGGALVDVCAASGGLLVVEAGGTEAAEAPQGVVA